VADWYREGRDVYREIAGKAIGKPAAEITEEERQLGKVWFLMSLYGAGPRKMAQEIGMEEREAKAFYRAFHEGLPQIKGLSNPPPRTPRPDYTPGLVERALRRRGYLKTPFGMHLHPEQWGEHKMLNKLIQGTAALVMKRALIRVASYLDDAGHEARMVATIHDEIILDSPPGEVGALAERLPEVMDDEPEITTYVPLEVDIEASSTTWADKLPYDTWKGATT
jgi:DNA polymerase-1